MSFDALQSQGSLLEKLTASLDTKSGYIDDKLWKPQMGKGNTGSAVIRFLPPSHGNELPWVQRWQHAFKVNERWFIEECPTSLGRKCPVCDANSDLWKTQKDADRALASSRKRKLKYYANIYVVSDPANPANEGKVFVYSFGPKIFEKITDAMKPKFADIEAIDPTNLWHGANFHLRISLRTGTKFWVYDDSSFGKKGTLGDFNNDQLRAIYDQQYNLSEYVDPTVFKSYEELSRKFADLTGGRPKIDEEVRSEEVSFSTPDFNSPDITASAPPITPELKDELNNLTATAPKASEDNHDYFEGLMSDMEM